MALGAVLAAALALGGCGVPPWEVGQTTAPPTRTSTAAPTIETVVNELASGSTRRTLTAGAITLTVDYWSSLSMDQWTAGALKPLDFSMSATLANDEGQGVFLSRVTMTPAVDGPDGALPAPSPLVDSSNISPGYLVKSPYSYSQHFEIGSLDPAATSITLGISYELLLQTTPESSEYAKQTASDTLTIAIAPTP